MRRTTIGSYLATLMMLAAVAPISGQSMTASSVPVRELSAPEATSVDRFGLVVGIRALPGGKLLVNDGRAHQLLLLDAQLGNKTIVLDSVSGVTQSYGRGRAPLLPYLADSSLFVDVASVSLVVITPGGAIARTMAPPIPAHVFDITNDNSGTDARGNIVYRIDESRPSMASRDTAVLRRAIAVPDSFLIVRASFGSRSLDTIGHVKSPTGSRVSVTNDNGRFVATFVENPMPALDDYTILSDGSVAFVRGHDYHVELVQSNGQRVTGPKLPFDWKRLTDSDKQGLLDSLKARDERDQAALKAFVAARAGGGSGAGAGAAGAGAAGVSVKPPSAVGEATRSSSDNPTRTEVARVYARPTLDQIADYYPPIRRGALKADLDANLWILPTTSAQSKNGELIYDVVNNRGQLTQRVRVPAGRSIAGFGKNGVVYLMSKEPAGWMLERTHIVLN